jgi:hypothetical protein
MLRYQAGGAAGEAKQLEFQKQLQAEMARKQQG